MGARFLLDASSFEKLLAAAWVLQCEQDEKLRMSDQLDTSLVRVESVDDQNSYTEPPAYFAAEKAALASGTLPPVRVDPPALTEALQESADVLAEPSPHDVTPAPNPAVIAALHAMASATEDQTIADIGRWFSGGFLSIQSRARRLQKRTVRLVVSKRSLRLARVSLVPILLLFVMFAFSLSQVWKQKAAQASQRAEVQDTPYTLKDSLQAHETRFAESLMLEEEAAKQEVTSQHPPSHLHVTDSATASAVQALSPYEVEGLRRQAEYGDQSAALALGMAYETGHAVHQSCTRAAEWIAFAAANDNPAAEYNLGLRYFQGDGLPQDASEGAKWLAKAMAAGYPKVLSAEKRSSE